MGKEQRKIPDKLMIFPTNKKYQQFGQWAISRDAASSRWTSKTWSRSCLVGNSKEITDPPPKITRAKLTPFSPTCLLAHCQQLGQKYEQSFDKRCNNLFICKVQSLTSGKDLDTLIGVQYDCPLWLANVTKTYNSAVVDYHKWPFIAFLLD